MQSATKASWTVGDRIRSAEDRHKGTIRYVGQVNGSDGEWIGVEWDDASRGRHDGSVDSVQYFKCSKPNSGSFIRPKRCLRATSFLQATEFKYADRVESPEGRFLLGKNTEESSEFKIPVDFVGVTEIDLEDNLLTDFEELVHLPPHTVELRLGKNQLNPLIDHSIFPDFALMARSLRKLMLNSVENALDHVCVLAKNGCLPSLKELYLGDNKIETLGSVPLAGLEHLSLLDLTGNLISDWKALSAISSLPSLTTLVLDNNQLDYIGPIEEAAFASLESLSLYSNCISTCNAFHALQQFPLLSSLRIQKNPIENEIGFRQARYLMIGLLPNLRILNRSEITSRERNSAEVEFLRFCGSEPNCFTNSPRHVALLEQFKDIVLPNSAQTSTTLERKGTISLKIRSNLASSMTLPATARKFLQSMKLDLLAELARRHFKIESTVEIDLYYLDMEIAFPILLDDWSQSLEYYTLRSGGEIIVETKGNPEHLK